MNKPLISVVVPVYKVEEYLDECVQSLISQTYTNLEIILVDDGSPDNCPQMCDEWAKKDLRIKVIHKTNGGLSSARNAGLDATKGDYISFVDSDDFFDSMMYEKLYEGMTMCPNMGISSIQFYKYVDGRVEIYNKDWDHNDIILTKPMDFCYKTLIQEVSQTATNKLYKREILEGVYFREGKLNEDVLFMFDLSKNVEKRGCNMIDIPYYAYYYRMRQGSISNFAQSLLLAEIHNLETIMEETNKPEIKNISYKMKNFHIYSFCLTMLMNKAQNELVYDKKFQEYYSILKKIKTSDIYWKRLGYVTNCIKLELVKRIPFLYCHLLKIIKH